MKTCTKCHVEKALTEFNKRQGRCKTCQSAYDAAYRVTHRAERAARLMAYRYGISQDELDGLFAYQKGLCAGGCGRPATCIDHNHDTGDVRGILCHACNQRDALAVLLPYAVLGVGAWA